MTILCIFGTGAVTTLLKQTERWIPISALVKRYNSRYSPLKIQTLSSGLHKQIFNDAQDKKLSAEDLEAIKSHLQKHGLWDKSTPPLPDVDLHLPSCHSSNVDEYFREQANKQIAPYVEHAKTLLQCSRPPPPPDTWVYKAGWTRYDPVARTAYAVECPLEDEIVFDIETLVQGRNAPMLGTAVTPKAWYSWCSEYLTNPEKKLGDDHFTPDHMVPFQAATVEDPRPRIIVGHNVSFDRSFMKEQYYIKAPQTYFLDTMSMHIVVSGQTSFQRILYQAEKSQSRRKEVVEREEQAAFRGPPNTKWMKQTSMNNLDEVYQHHCKGVALKKHIRDVFIKGTIDDVREDFQELMKYCATDVCATLEVFKVLWPQLNDRLPHPVSLAGMFEMGSTYLPINTNWLRYKDAAEQTNNQLKQQLQEKITTLMDQACQLMEDGRYKDDLWLWNLDWSVQRRIGKRKLHMAGYPKWYRDMCARPIDVSRGHAEEGDIVAVTTKRQVVPKLLKLTWDGFPLHYHRAHGWGYLVPWVEEIKEEEEGEEGSLESYVRFPLKKLQEFCFNSSPTYIQALENPSQKLELILDDLYKKYEVEEDEDTKANQWREIITLEKQLTKMSAETKKDDGLVESGQHYHKGNGPYNVGIKGVDFFRLPHKDGPQNKVGNPLSKDFLSKIESGVLKSASGTEASMVLRLSSMTSYWDNNKKRVGQQMCVKLSENQLPDAVTRSPLYNPSEFLGAILPRVVPAGTVSRRAVEPTWLTASNAYEDRVGSEMKAMVQSPPGYHFVGADVDSQELWIAAILGDAYFKGVHGCTAFGWMTLCGNKADGTDLHSKTASIVGISRDQAKVFNYGRIYGAGQKFAQRLLMQFNHRLSAEEARTKARAMYLATKGKRSRRKVVTQEEWDRGEDFDAPGRWEGGSESYMFNQLEEIAKKKMTRTPVLDCRISKALESSNVDDDFMTSRVNWVVQSSAVDYLHLMLVCMKGLLEEYDIDGRFAISIHDEVRYLVKSEDRYRAALALQIANVLTRSMFAYRLGMNDLPQSVAFFSAVDIDICLRKEVTMDCKTPSNPDGLEKTYGIPPGEALTIYDILKKTNGSLRKEDQPCEMLLRG